MHNLKPLLFKTQYLLVGLVYKVFSIIGIKLPPFASASAIIENDNHEILVVNLSYKKGYALPGGLLQPNESFEDGLKREIKEETNLEVEVDRLINLYYSYDHFPTVNALYHAKITNGTTKSSVEGRVSWKRPTDIINMIAHSDNRQGIKDYFKL